MAQAPSLLDLRDACEVENTTLRSVGLEAIAPQLNSSEVKGEACGAKGES